MKKVLILSDSPRKGGNSDLLCDEFMRGAKEFGNNVTKINVDNKKISPCCACLAGFDADVLMLASPVYFYLY